MPLSTSDMSSDIARHHSPSVGGWPLWLLRIEGAELLGVAVVLYGEWGGSWGVFAALFLAPDLAFVAYAAGPRRGAAAYNLLHTTTLPLLLGMAALAAGRPAPAALGLIWLAHIGFDRMLGYGLKYGSGFGNTHLGGRSVPHPPASTSREHT